MKNKNGFTLVEILGVITILSVLALIAIPTIDNIVTKNREKLYDSQIKTIEDGLKTWADANAMYLPEDGDDGLLLSLGILKLSGFVDEDIKNPNTNLCFSNNMMVSIVAVKEGYAYYVDEESGLDGTEEDCSTPTVSDFIYLKGSSTVTLNLNDTYEEPGYITFDSNGNMAAGTVTSLIKDRNGTVVSSIDTTESSKTPYTITYTYGSATSIRTINVLIADPVGTIYAFDYIDHVQIMTLKRGTYKLEVWGPNGSGVYGGKGGYSAGNLTLENDTQLYIYTGGSNGYNGGGSPNNPVGPANGGGGATDIRIATDSLYARVIVAGGGGGGGQSSGNGGVGGGLTGANGSGGANGGSQILGGSSTYCGTTGKGGFGSGGSSVSCTTAGGGSGGGGWYGGSTDYSNYGGGGGSGWIYTETAFTTWQTGNGSDSANWLLNSSYYLANAQTIAGNGTMPTHDGTGTMTGNSGNGYVKITKIS